MRDILFKAKRIDNGEWVEGFFVNAIEEYGNGERTAEIIKINAERICSGEYSYLESYVVDINTLCQYTGLTDKNGNKIWENDVVKDNVIFGNVVWDENTAQFMIDDIYDGYQEYSGWWNEVEVIGNIFDNPELLGV